MAAHGNHMDRARVRCTWVARLAGAPIRCVLTAIFFVAIVPSTLFAQDVKDMGIGDLKRNYEAAEKKLKTNSKDENAKNLMREIEGQLWHLAREDPVNSKNAGDMIRAIIMPEFVKQLELAHDALDEIKKRSDDIEEEVSPLREKVKADGMTADDRTALLEAYEEMALLRESALAIQAQVTRLQLVRMATYRQPPWDSKVIKALQERDYPKTIKEAREMGEDAMTAIGKLHVYVGKKDFVGAAGEFQTYVKNLGGLGKIINDIGVEQGNEAIKTVSTEGGSFMKIPDGNYNYYVGGMNMKGVDVDPAFFDDLKATLSIENNIHDWPQSISKVFNDTVKRVYEEYFYTSPPSPGNSIQTEVQFGDAAMKEGRAEAALVHFEEAKRIYDHDLSFGMRWRYWWKAGDPAKLVKKAQTALAKREDPQADTASPPTPTPPARIAVKSKPAARSNQFTGDATALNQAMANSQDRQRYQQEQQERERVRASKREQDALVAQTRRRQAEESRRATETLASIKTRRETSARAGSGDDDADRDADAALAHAAEIIDRTFSKTAETFANLARARSEKGNSKGAFEALQQAEMASRTKAEQLAGLAKQMSSPGRPAIPPSEQPAADGHLRIFIKSGDDAIDRKFFSELNSAPLPASFGGMLIPKDEQEAMSLVRQLHEQAEIERATAQGKPPIGGVELGYAEALSVSDAITGATVDPDTGEVAFLDRNGRPCRLAEGMQKEIIDALLFLRSEYGSIENLAFTLDIEKSEMDRCKGALERYLAEHKRELERLPPGVHRIQALPVRNIPRFLGGDFGDTIVGKIALDADVGLKFLSHGLDPATGETFTGIPELQQALSRGSGREYFVRLWLDLRWGNIEETARGITVDVGVGIRAKAIRYAPDGSTVDEGEAPEEVQEVVDVLVRNYDLIAERVPSWKALREVYRGIILVQYMERMGVLPKKRIDPALVRKYATPDFVNGLVGVIDSGSMSTIGGVDYYLRNEYNASQDSRNNFLNMLCSLAAEGSRDPYYRACASLMKWDLDGAIAASDTALRDNPKDARYLNLRANARSCKALRLRKPERAFDPERLMDILDDPTLETLRKAAVESDLDMDGSTASLAASDYAAAGASDPFLPWFNLERLNEVRALPGERWLKQALATGDDAEKMRLHRKAAEVFFETGNYAKAAQRYAWLCYREPDSLELQAMLTRSYLEQARSTLPIDPEPVRVLVLPLEDVQKSESNAWLSRGLVHLLGHVALVHGKLSIVDPAEIDRACAMFAVSGEDLRKPGLERNLVANSQAIGADVIVTGEFVRFGAALKVTLQIEDRASGRKQEAEVKGSLKASHKFLQDLYNEILAFTGDLVTEEPRYELLPETPEELQTWCTVRDLQGSGRDTEAEALLRKAAGEGNGEATLQLAERMCVEGHSADAVALLDQAHLPEARLWRVDLLKGALAQASGSGESAVQHFKSASTRNPKSVIPLLALIEACDSGPDRRWANERLVEMEYAGAEPYLELAGELIDSGDRRRALRVVNKYLNKAHTLTADDLGSIESIQRRAAAK